MTEDVLHAVRDSADEATSLAHEVASRPPHESPAADLLPHAAPSLRPPSYRETPCRDATLRDATLRDETLRAETLRAETLRAETLRAEATSAEAASDEPRIRAATPRRHDLEVFVDRADGILLITPVGDVDMVTGGLFLEALIAAISTGETNLIVDLDQVPFMDSTAVSIFLSANRALNAVGGRLRVVAGEDRRDIFRFAWVDQICAVHRCIADAVRDIADSGPGRP